MYKDPAIISNCSGPYKLEAEVSGSGPMEGNSRSGLGQIEGNGRSGFG